MNRVKIYLCWLAFVALVSDAAIRADVVDRARQSGVTAGVIVHVGCADGRDTARLVLNDRVLVQGLDQDPAQVQAARNYLLQNGLSGVASANLFDGRKLPYPDNFVNLLIDDGEPSAPREEILRVLVPGGVAVLGDKELTKPWPSTIDQWTHYLHSADNNAVSRDRVVGIPRSLQWVAEPRWGRSHEQMASVSAAATANGKIYYIEDEGPLFSIRFHSQWHIIARDAFNGQLLWKRPLSQWVDHLRHFRSGPAHLPRRLVAVENLVYVTDGLSGPVVSLDGDTGKQIKSYSGTDRTEEILIHDGTLFVVVGTSEISRIGEGLFARGEPAPTDYRQIKAIDIKSGEIKWERDFTKDYLLPLTMAYCDGRVYGQTVSGVFCLDAATGKQRWLTPRQTPARRMAFSGPTLVATNDVVLCADRDTETNKQDQVAKDSVLWGVHGWNQAGFSRNSKSTLIAYAASDGKPLWSAPCREGYNSPVDVFVVGGIVYVGPDFKGYDVKTGELKREVNLSAPRVGMAHHRCYRNKASEQYLFTGKSGIEVWSWEEGRWLSNNSWVRGTCQYGIIPANGLLYAPPDACACFLTVKAPGFVALGRQYEPKPVVELPDNPQLRKGPAFARQLSAGNVSDDWPTFRHDGARSGAAACRLSDQPQKRWSAKLGGELTQPVVVGNRVFVASADAHTLHALDRKNGKSQWQFVAGGRIDSPPTYYRGRLLFGSADGWVYCLDASDGSLVWQFKAAPYDRWVSAYGRLESAWPVHGALLVQNDTVYVTAGRSTYHDGGIALYCLDPQTGQVRDQYVFSHLDPETGEQLTAEAKFNMEGTTCDVLSGDGQRVFLKYFTFDGHGQPIQDATPRLYSITSLLGEDWFVRSYWLVGAGMPPAGWGGWARAANMFPSGRILCQDGSLVYGYGRKAVAGGPVGHTADTYHLFCQEMPKTTAIPPTNTAKRRRSKNANPPPTAGAVRWSRDDSLIVRAMVLAQDRLAVAGPPPLGEKDSQMLAFKNEPEAFARFIGQRGTLLRIVRASDGEVVSEQPLPAMPVFDGLAAAGGQLFISLKSGELVCYGP